MLRLRSARVIAIAIIAIPALAQAQDQSTAQAALRDQIPQRIQRTPESYIIEDAAREATQQMQQAIMARAKVAEQAALITELQRRLAEAEKAKQ